MKLQFTYRFALVLLFLCLELLVDSNCFAEAITSLRRDIATMGLQALLNLDIKIDVPSNTPPQNSSKSATAFTKTSEEIDDDAVSTNASIVLNRKNLNVEKHDHVGKSSDTIGKQTQKQNVKK